MHTAYPIHAKFKRSPLARYHGALMPTAYPFYAKSSRAQLMRASVTTSNLISTATSPSLSSLPWSVTHLNASPSRRPLSPNFSLKTCFTLLTAFSPTNTRTATGDCSDEFYV